jgi:hypothetical protein
VLPAREMQILISNLILLSDTKRNLDFANLDPNDDEDREQVEERLPICIALLEKYNLMPSLYKVMREAAEFYSRGADDLARSWTARWQRRALDAGVACYGIESNGDKVGKFVKDNDREIDATKVLTLAKKAIPQAMAAQYTTAVLI